MVLSPIVYVISYTLIQTLSPAFENAGLFGIDLAKPKPIDTDPPHMFIFHIFLYVYIIFIYI